MSNIPLPDSAGRIDTFTRTEGADTVHMQAIVPVDPATGDPLQLAQEATLAALNSGARLALANKESLVLAGDLVHLDQACGEKSGWSLDYVHGDADAASLAQNGATAALLGAMDKRALFPAIAAGGVLPRKTFSMGEATEKRYYMECRAIEKNNEKEMAAKE